MKIWERKMKILTKSSVGKHVGFSPEKRPHHSGGKNILNFSNFSKTIFFCFFFFHSEIIFRKV